MNKNYYTFLVLIFLLLFLLYSIVMHKYKEYKIDEHIETISMLIDDIKQWNKKALEIIEYKKNEAFKNKILKNDNLKNKAEIVVFVTTEDRYNHFVKPIEEEKIISKSETKILDETYWMTIYQKWVWFLFKKDLR